MLFDQGDGPATQKQRARDPRPEDASSNDCCGGHIALYAAEPQPCDGVFVAPVDVEVCDVADEIATGAVTENDEPVSPEELTGEQKRANVIRLAFGGSEERFKEFVETVRQAIPAGTGVVLRGSAVTGVRWKDNAPFDSEGPGTSDLDLTLVGGDEVIALYKVTGFFVPGIHSRPLSDDDPDIAPDLVPLRENLMKMVGRPVNIQGTRDFVMYLRGELIGQPYLVLIDKNECSLES